MPVDLDPENEKEKDIRLSFDKVLANQLTVEGYDVLITNKVATKPVDLYVKNKIL